MQIDRHEAHNVKNQLAIAMGMIELSMKYVKKDPIEVDKIMDKLEKSLNALKKINEFLELKRDPEHS